MTVTGFDRVPLAGSIFEPTSPLWQVGAVLAMSSPVAGLDHPKALARETREGLRMVGELGHRCQGRAGK